MIDVNKFDAIKVVLASPDKVRQWSRGEVTKPETINYRTLKPERDGLFCEKIFGPIKDFECNCGKYKKNRYKGTICDRCGVEVTQAKVRRERMGHIELAAPVTHIWYFKGIPSRIGLVLDISPRDLEEIIYFVSYVVIDPGETTLMKKSIISDKEYRAYYEKYGNTFKVGMGAEAIRDLLASVDLKAEIKVTEEEIRRTQGQKLTRLLKRLEVLNAFDRSGNKPEWMVLEAIPIIPPDLRPLIQLDGGRFASSDLNDLYRRVINRNNRLRKLIELDAPGIIVQNEKRMLQEAVDSLIDNGRRGRPVNGPGNRPLKSLTSMLKGKQGRFRQNLLGKRVDYSGRSVIVVGPDLKMYECGIPKEMAVELFKPHVIRQLMEREICGNIKSAKRLIESLDEKIWDVVEDVIDNHPVLLNRAPTLHRLGIQAFFPKLVDGRAIRLHPLVTTAFNADFDGDQMAVHVPLGEKAKHEARTLMLASNNILNPKDGKPVVTPSQDMVLGNYYLTLERKGAIGEGSIFKNMNEASLAYQNKYIELHSRIVVPVKSLNKTSFKEEIQNRYLITTLGKMIFNDILPISFPYVNEPTLLNIQTAVDERFLVDVKLGLEAQLESLPIVQPFKKKTLGLVIAEIFNRYKTQETSEMLDALKDLGFVYSTIAGFTVAASDIMTLDSKDEIIAESDKKIQQIHAYHRRGLMTEGERYQKVIDTWNGTKAKIYSDLEDMLNRESTENSIYMMMDSGARGSISNFGQLAGMRGLMAKPSGEPIEIPIKSSFYEGLTVAEFFISTHGARKGLADTALKTADSGYLTRRLVDVAQDVIVREDDCNTDRGVVVKAIIDNKDGSEIESLHFRLVGRYPKNDIIVNGEIIVSHNEIMTEESANRVIDAGIEEVEIRSVLTCNTFNGVCKKCYGSNLATGVEVNTGEVVGIMAAQSIGEPGTQLTMRTFHTGGVASDNDITQGLPRIQELFEARNPKAKALISEIKGTISQINEINESRYEIAIKNELEERRVITQYGARLRVKVGDEVTFGRKLTEGSIDPKELLMVTDAEAVEHYIIKEVQKVYRLQGVDISDKHIEVIARQMLSKIRIIDHGDTDLLPSKIVDLKDFSRINKTYLQNGQRPAVGKSILLGITKVSLETNSFLSAASFQETTRVLTDAVVNGKIDNLSGLKENIIMGKLIPAGTGIKQPDPIIVEEVEQEEVMLEDILL